MPELPEVETICRALKQQIINCQIKKLIIRKDSLRWKINDQLANILPNKIIKTIQRRAKYLLINCIDTNTVSCGHLIIHLGMSGKIIILPENSLNYNNINKHDHVDIMLHNNTIIRYHDPRRFGAILWTTEDPYKHFLLHHLGPEPFDTTFSSEYLFKKAHNKLLPIKQFIMDHKIVVGIGNIYANEALFAAKINPLCITKNLNLIQFDNLIKSIKIILTTAIAKGGTTLKDFYNINGEPGYFAQTLQVYGRSNKPCLICKTILSKINIAQRSTFFCNTCQPTSQNL